MGDGGHKQHPSLEMSDGRPKAVAQMASSLVLSDGWVRVGVKSPRHSKRAMNGWGWAQTALVACFE